MVLMARLLLPFTHGIDASAITSALALAYRMDATLTLLSLVQLPLTSGNPRWETLQQSQDFLVYAQHKAIRLGVPVEPRELLSHNAIKSIRTCAREMECTGIVLIVRSGSGVLLATHEVKQLLEGKSTPVYIISLPVKKRFFSSPQWLSHWNRRR